MLPSVMFFSRSTISYNHNILYTIVPECNEGPQLCIGVPDRFFSYETLHIRTFDEACTASFVNQHKVYDMRTSGHISSYITAAMTMDASNIVLQRPALITRIDICMDIYQIDVEEGFLVLF